MKKLIFAIGIGALLLSTNLMAIEESDIEEVLGLMSIKDGQPNGCFGYGVGIFETQGPDSLTLKYSRHGHKLTTTCTFSGATHDTEHTGKRFLCLLANEGDGSNNFKYTTRSKYIINDNSAVITCNFYSFKPFPHAND